MAAFLSRRSAARNEFNRIEEHLIEANDQQVYEWSRGNDYAEQYDVEGSPFDWSQNSAALALLWKSAREILDKGPFEGHEYLADYPPKQNTS